MIDEDEGESPSFFQVSETETVFNITINTNLTSSIGTYKMKVTQQDIFTKYEAINVVTANIIQEDSYVFDFLS